MNSTLSQSQAYIPILDGALVVLAVGFVTAMPPGVAFGRAWGVTSVSNTKARRHSAALRPAQRSPESSLRHLDGRSISSPQRHAHSLGSAKEPRSPPPTATTHNSEVGDSAVGSSSRRYSPSWAGLSRQQSASCKPVALPPYERPAYNYTRVPYVPPQTSSLSQQYGQGNVVESHVVVEGSDGSRTGGSGPGASGRRFGARQSPRANEDDLVRHDSIW